MTNVSPLQIQHIDVGVFAAGGIATGYLGRFADATRDTKNCSLCFSFTHILGFRGASSCCPRPLTPYSAVHANCSRYEAYSAKCVLISFVRVRVQLVPQTNVMGRLWWCCIMRNRFTPAGQFYVRDSTQSAQRF